MLAVQPPEVMKEFEKNFVQIEKNQREIKNQLDTLKRFVLIQHHMKMDEEHSVHKANRLFELIDREEDEVEGGTTKKELMERNEEEELMDEFMEGEMGSSSEWLVEAVTFFAMATLFFFSVFVFMPISIACLVFSKAEKEAHRPPKDSQKDQ